MRPTYANSRQNATRGILAAVAGRILASMLAHVAAKPGLAALLGLAVMVGAMFKPAEHAASTVVDPVPAVDPTGADLAAINRRLYTIESRLDEPWQKVASVVGAGLTGAASARLIQPHKRRRSR